MRDTTEQQARDIFLELETVDSGTMKQALDRLVGDDQPLREAVERLLDAKAAADNARFFTGDTASKDSSPITEKAGSLVGPYKILQQIGEGGFGSVFLAEQTKPIRRRVALKIIKLGMDTKQVIARFEAERQALALMDHPHIASVLDAGATETGRPFFVMEYVVGDPITEFADAHKLSVQERLALFTQVCSAVQHAHTKGIIHRDIKPGNVLVSMTDGRPFARVIDFGIAKATASPLTDKTLFTEHRQLIGTLEYMSPEQAEGLPDIDTRTDVYALGVMLYELLTGATPIDGKRLRSAAWDEMRRIIKEEEPPAPSLCLSRNVDSLAKVAAARQAEPVKLSSLIRGELDWIAIKALDKDRARRYESPNELAADIQRHLDGDSVVAAPPSRGYRVRKFVRRNKSVVVSATLISSFLILGVIGTTMGMLWAFNEKRLKTEETARAEIAKIEAIDAKHRTTAALQAKREALRIAERSEGLARLEEARTLGSNNKFGAAVARLQGIQSSAVSSEWWWTAWGCVRSMGMNSFNSPDAGSSIENQIQAGNAGFSAEFSDDGNLVHLYPTSASQANGSLAALTAFRFHDRAVTDTNALSRRPSARTVSSDQSTYFPAPADNIASGVRLTRLAMGKVSLTLELRTGAIKYNAVFGTIAPGRAWIDWESRRLAIDSRNGYISLYAFDESGFSNSGLTRGLESGTKAVWYNHRQRITRVVYEDWTYAEFSHQRPDITTQPQWLEYSPDKVFNPNTMTGYITTRKLVYSKDGSRLYVGSYSGWVTAFDTANWQPLWSEQFIFPSEYDTPRYQFGTLSLSPDQQTLLVSTEGPKAYLVNAHTGKTRTDFSTGENPDGDLVVPKGDFVSDDRFVISTVDGRLVLHDANSNSVVLVFQKTNEHVYEVAYLEKRQLLCFVTHVRNGEERLAEVQGGSVYMYRISPSDGKAELLWHRQTSSGGRSLEFSPDGSVVATSERGGQATLWNAQTGDRIAALEVLGIVGTRNHSHVVSGIDFHPTQPIVATAANGGRVRLWSSQSGTLLAEVSTTGYNKSAEGAGRAKDLAFHPSGKTLSVGFEERILHIDLEHYSDTIESLRQHLVSKDP